MRTQDMTQGHPLKLILAFSLPLMLGNAFQQLYTMVDTIVVGQGIGVAALAAVGASVVSGVVSTDAASAAGAS